MFIACDIGGTQFRVAKSADLKNFDEPVIEATPNNPKEGLQLIAETIRNLTKDDLSRTGSAKIANRGMAGTPKTAGGAPKIDAMIFGIAGVLNSGHDFLLKSPHLPAWERILIREFFAKEFPGAKVFLENDTDIVGLGEATDGAGRGFEIVVYITVSTGIGGAKIVKGKFERNRFGFEPGFQILNNETGENWEDLASGTAVEKKYKLHPKIVAKTDAWEKIERDIAIGIHNSIVHWSPDVVVVGGAMARDLDALRLRESIADLMKIHPEIPEIRIAELGSIGGVHGGFAFLRQKFEA